MTRLLTDDTRSKLTAVRLEVVYRPTLGIAGFVNPPIFDIFDPKYHPAEIILDDGWVEEETA